MAAAISPAALSDVRMLAAYFIFLASYLVLALGKFPGLKIDRTGAAIIGAVGMAAFRIVRPVDALRHIDFQTIVLLFSMMLIVGVLHLVGFFEWNAEAVLRRLKPHQLLPAVIFTCGFLSAFFVNDIVCLARLGPVALAGLFIDWAVLHWIHVRKVALMAEKKSEIPLPQLDLWRLT